MKEQVTFFDGFDNALRTLIAGACGIAGRKGIEPADFTAALVTSLVGRAFDVASGLVPAEKAAQMIGDHARAALNHRYFLDGVKYVEAEARALDVPTLFDAIEAEQAHKVVAE
jgi:hypothetical protein